MEQRSGIAPPHKPILWHSMGERCVGLQKICMIFYITPTRKEVRNSGEEKDAAL